MCLLRHAIATEHVPALSIDPFRWRLMIQKGLDRLSQAPTSLLLLLTTISRWDVSGNSYTRSFM